MKAYQLKIELKGTQIWRRVIIPTGATFYRLYDTIQRSMGWMGESLYEYHLYEFDKEFINSMLKYVKFKKTE